MSWMLKNSRGARDGLWTIAVAGAAIVLLKVLLSGVTLPIAGHIINCGTIDGLLAAAVLAGTVGTYTAKRIKGGKDDQTGSPDLVAAAIQKIQALRAPGVPTMAPPAAPAVAQALAADAPAVQSRADSGASRVGLLVALVVLLGGLLLLLTVGEIPVWVCYLPVALLLVAGAVLQIRARHLGGRP